MRMRARMKKKSVEKRRYRFVSHSDFCAPTWARTRDPQIMSLML
jgi:hypothetical protein